MEWKSIDLSKETVKFPGCIDLDLMNGCFVSATFETDVGLVRIRKGDYSIYIEKKVVPCIDKYEVSYMLNKQKISNIFDTQYLADEQVVFLENSAVTDINKSLIRVPL